MIAVTALNAIKIVSPNIHASYLVTGPSLPTHFSDKYLTDLLRSHIAFAPAPLSSLDQRQPALLEQTA